MKFTVWLLLLIRLSRHPLSWIINLHLKPPHHVRLVGFHFLDNFCVFQQVLEIDFKGKRDVKYNRIKSWRNSRVLYGMLDENRVVAFLGYFCLNLNIAVWFHFSTFSAHNPKHHPLTAVIHHLPTSLIHNPFTKTFCKLYSSHNLPKNLRKFHF